jgi:hypothetical protein
LPDEQFTLGDAATLLGPDVAQAALDALEEAQVIEVESRANGVYRIPRWVRLFARESVMREGV